MILKSVPLSDPCKDKSCFKEQHDQGSSSDRTSQTDHAPLSGVNRSVMDDIAQVDSSSSDDTNVSTSRLDLDGSLTYKKVTSVLNKLQRDSTLQELRVSFSFKGKEQDIVMSCLGKMLAKNKGLKKIYLTTPTLSFYSAMAIANGLKHNWTLLVFSLKDSTTGEVDVLVNRTNDSNHRHCWEDTEQQQEEDNGSLI